MTAVVYELIDVQSQAGQQMLNVFHFVDPAGAADLPTLVTDYHDDVLPLVAAFQTSSVSHTSIRYRQVYPTATLMLERSFTAIPGAISSDDYLLPEVAWSFKFVLSNPTVILAGGFTGHIKRGGCRVPGVGREHIDQTVVSSSIITSAASWKPELLSPGGSAAVLCVASFLDGATPRVRHATVQSYTIVGSISDPSGSTQNTRKVLRGRTF